MRRLVLLLVAAAIVAAGLAVHLLAPKDAVGDAIGDVLYAVLVVLLVAFAAPWAAWWGTGAVALAWCVGVELLQLTSLPASLGAAFEPLKLVLGTTFAPWDLLWYALGVVLAAGVDGALRRRGGRAVRRPEAG